MRGKAGESQDRDAAAGWPGLRRAVAAQALPLALATGAASGAALAFDSQTGAVAWTLLGLAALACAGRWRRGLPLMLAGALLMGGLAAWDIARADPGWTWRALASRPVWATGTVAEVRRWPDTPTRLQLVLHDVEIYGQGVPVRPNSLRLSVDARRGAAFAPGDGVAAQVMVQPPQGPRFAGERDWRLWRYFDRARMNGFVRGEIVFSTVPAPPSKSLWAQLMTRVDAARAAVAARAQPYADGVVGALLVGERRGIPDALDDAYRASGLTHLLAISGFQLTVVGGGLFFLFRWLMAWWPWLALRTDTKRIAAVAALLVAGGYTLLAGAEVSVVRALLMTTVLFMAVLAGRVRGLLRTWALALLLILALEPHLVMSAGLQLSFAAVLGLLLWEGALPHGYWHGWSGKLKGVLASSIVAGSATLPVVAGTFGQVSLVGLLANLLAVPMMAAMTWVGMAALAAWPLGLEEPFLTAMGLGVGLVNAWATWLAGIPGAMVMVPGWGWMPLTIFCGVTLAGMVLRRKTVVALGLGLVTVMALGLSQFGARPAAVVLAEGDIGLEATDDGGWVVVWGQTEGYRGRLLEAFGRRWGPVEGRREPGNSAVVRLAGAPSPEDCALAGGIVAALGGGACPDKTLVAGQFGHYAVFTGGRWQVAPRRCLRPWQMDSPDCDRSHDR